MGGNQVETWLLPTTAVGSFPLESPGPPLPNLDGEGPGFMASTSSHGTLRNSSVIWSVSTQANACDRLTLARGAPSL